MSRFPSSPPLTFMQHTCFLGHFSWSHILGVRALPDTFPLCPSSLGLDKGPSWSAPAYFASLTVHSSPSLGESRMEGQGKLLQPIGTGPVACPSVHFPITLSLQPFM